MDKIISCPNKQDKKIRLHFHERLLSCPHNKWLFILLKRRIQSERRVSEVDDIYSNIFSEPKNEPLIMIKKWQLVLCEGNHCAAALLNYFIYWHKIKKNLLSRVKKANDIAESHGDKRSQDETLYQFHTEKELIEGLLGLFGETKIGESLKFLKDKEIIEITGNPNPRYKFDKTRFFYLNEKIIHDFLQNEYSVSIVENDGCFVENDERHVENNERHVEYDEAITENTNDRLLSKKAFLSEKICLAAPNEDRRKKFNRISRSSEVQRQEKITQRKLEEKNKLHSFVPSDDAKAIIDIWNKQVINGQHLVNHNEGTKTFKKISETIDSIKDGTFFKDKAVVPDELRNKKFTLNKIETAIERFALSALSDEYTPSNKEFKKNTTLLSFFYNSFSSSDKLEWKSPFLFYVQNEPKKLNEKFVTLDEESEVAEVLMERFRRLTKMNGDQYSTKDKQNFAKCIDRCKDFIGEFRDNINLFDHHKMTCDFLDDETMIAKYIMDFLEDADWFDNPTTSVLCSDKMFSKWLPEYLEEIGQWRD